MAGDSRSETFKNLVLPGVGGLVGFLAAVSWRQGRLDESAVGVLLLLAGFAVLIVTLAPRKASEAVEATTAAIEADETPATPAVDESIGTRPAALAAARAGGPDDLKAIKGVGPRLEALLHRLGFFHFDQIAAWTADEVAWVDEHLEGFKGRVSRDDWVSQAKILADGGETAFSARLSADDQT